MIKYYYWLVVEISEIGAPIGCFQRRPKEGAESVLIQKYYYMRRSQRHLLAAFEKKLVGNSAYIQFGSHQ